ncbi:MAG TPA: hypothetical protein VIF14_18890 [Alphaproteobacteria bacterium]|jgi:hypothetical protein
MDREERTNISADTPLRHPGEAPPVPDAHRRIPASLLALMGLCLGWFVPIGWLVYWGHTDTVLTMLLVTVFTAVALGVPWLLVRTSRGRIDATSAYRPRQWLRGQFETFTGRLPAREAAILILLPLAAAAVGITLMGVALAIAASGS